MKLTLASLLALCALHLSSQNLADFKLKDGWYDFKHITTSKLLMENFIGNYRYELKLRDFDQLIHKRASKDEKGYTHSTFQHYINNVPVENSELVIHSGKNNNYISVATNKLAEGVESQAPVITEKVALAKAIQVAGVRNFLWPDSLAEREINEEAGNNAATNYPKGTLAYTRLSTAPVSYKLCYRFAIRANPTYLCPGNLYRCS